MQGLPQLADLALGRLAPVGRRGQLAVSRADMSRVRRVRSAWLVHGFVSRDRHWSTCSLMRLRTPFVSGHVFCIQPLLANGKSHTSTFVSHQRAGAQLCSAARARFDPV